MKGICRIFALFFLLLLMSHAVADPSDAVILRFHLKIKELLEVRYNGNWGSICFDGLNDKAAKVACRQMGFRDGKRTTAARSVTGENLTIILDKVHCTGEEDDFGKCTFVVPTGNCQFALEVNCESDPALNGLFNVSLLGSPNHAHKGILHATKAGATDAVCYDSGTATTIAGIVCKQMGYSGVEKQTAANASSYSSFFIATCKGTELTLANCTLTHGNSCFSNSVIDIECKLDNASQSPFAVRLSQTSHVVAGASSGTVEVKKYGKWGVICDTGWDIKDASVICRQLGFKGAVPTTGFPTKAKFGQGTGIVVWNNVQCSGEEPGIAECEHDEVFAACNSSNASGVMCSTDKWPKIDICDKEGTLYSTGGVTFIQSTGYPTSNFDYNGSTVCKVELMSPTNFSVYIQQRMFQNNHNEYLLFKTSEGRVETLYGDNLTPGPMIFNTTKLTIEFRANGSAGTGKINIMVTASEPVFLKGQTNTQSGTTPITVPGLTTTTFPAPKYIGNSDTGNNAGVSAAVTVVVIVLLGVILGIILWRLGYIRFGRKTRDSDGNGHYDVSQVTNGAATAERIPENYVNVGGAYENVGEPVYVNSTFVADQPTNTSQGSSDHHTNYENMGDVAFNQDQHSGNTTALEQGSIVDRNHGNSANYSTDADEGESQYAKLEPVQRSEYADLRGLTAEQF